jgi:hypothetical protein
VEYISSSATTRFAKDGEEMKYVMIILFLAAIAGIEFYHELSRNEAPISLMCTASDNGMEPVGEVLRQHLESHR